MLSRSKIIVFVICSTKELSDVTNLRVTDVGQNHFTMSWTPPLSHFDYYLIKSYDLGNVGDMSKPLRVGSCSYGTVIHRDQSEISCDNLKACANISITVHTKIRRGTHDATSTGTKLEGVLIPGREPDSPKNLKIIHASAKVTRIQWEPPSKASGKIGHIVSVCRTFTSCDEPESVDNCTERETSEPWYRSYIFHENQHIMKKTRVFVTLVALFLLPDADNLTLVDIGPDYFTVSWMRPMAQFDYYWLEVYQMDDGSGTLTPQRVGLCANGTIVHRDQTQFTCDMFKPCSNVTITLHTQAKGTSELRSPGATLQGIFMPGKGIPEVVKLKQTAITEHSVTISWERPKGCFDDYVVTASADNTEPGSRETSAGTCGSGTIVPANETSVTCDGIEASGVSIMVQTRRLKSGGLISQGVTLQGIAMSKRVLPDVTNFTLIDVGPDYFTVSWARPSSYFDYYWVEVYDNSNGSDIHTPHRVGSCAYGNIIHRDQNQITCDKFKACVTQASQYTCKARAPQV
ncbi:hypothetical protein HPB51_029057 [Rhipicephalus microplus]|uniref:Fibronectin type-III domain-containing protein n=1 Tax=Rhipicephalus microplus TaxID=6941 RepID=A0A9J6CVQ8_RHIMP|nr:hypothetical protein HPB51_029057 [Rhipicephalus microplus]